MLYDDLEDGKRPVGQPFLRFNDACKRALNVFNLPITEWETLAEELEVGGRIHEGLIPEEAHFHDRAAEKLQKTLQNAANGTPGNPAATAAQAPVHTWGSCGRVCGSRIGLQSSAELQKLTYCVSVEGNMWWEFMVGRDRRRPTVLSH